MSIHDDRELRARGDTDPPTMFEKRPGKPRKAYGGRWHIPVGVYLGAFLAALVIIGIVLFTAASHGGAAPTGSTTGAGAVMVPTLLG